MQQPFDIAHLRSAGKTVHNEATDIQPLWGSEIFLINREIYLSPARFIRKLSLPQRGKIFYSSGLKIYSLPNSISNCFSKSLYSSAKDIFL